MTLAEPSVIHMKYVARSRGLEAAHWLRLSTSQIRIHCDRVRQKRDKSWGNVDFYGISEKTQTFLDIELYYLLGVNYQSLFDSGRSSSSLSSGRQSVPLAGPLCNCFRNEGVFKIKCVHSWPINIFSMTIVKSLVNSNNVVVLQMCCFPHLWAGCFCEAGGFTLGQKSFIVVD